MLETQMSYIHIGKQEEIWLSPMKKAPTPTEKSKKQRDKTKAPPKTSITQRLRTDLRLRAIFLLDLRTFVPLLHIKTMNIKKVSDWYQMNVVFPDGFFFF